MEGIGAGSKEAGPALEDLVVLTFFTGGEGCVWRGYGEEG